VEDIVHSGRFSIGRRLRHLVTYPLDELTFLPSCQASGLTRDEL
jgi:hypothetical protein